MGQEKEFLSVRPFSRSKKKQKSRRFSFQQQMTPHQNENPPHMLSVMPTPSSTPSPPLATTSPNIPSSITTVEAECSNITSKIIRINTRTVFAVSIEQGCLAFCLMIVGIISLLVVKDCKTEAGIAFCCAVAFFINGCLGVKNTRAPTKSKIESYIGCCIITAIIAFLMVGGCIYELGMFTQTSSSSSSWRYFLVAGMVMFWIEGILSLLGMRYIRKTFNDVPILNDNDGYVSGEIL